MRELTVPTIDVSAFRAPGDDGRDEIARQVDRAAREVGFMQVVGHGADPDALSAFTRAMDAFFALDLDVKNAYRCPPGVNRGYSPPKSEALRGSLGLASAADLFEAMNIGTSAADFPGADLPADDYAPNVFPAEIPGFEAATTRWFAEAGAVARVMMRIFGRALGLGEDYFAAFDRHPVDVLRMNNYRLPSADVELEPDQEGMGAHTDYGMVTVLWADPVPGLEIHLDGRWHPVMPRADGLLVNLGDALARWTNDQWISTMHRVAPPRVGGRLVPRRSAAYFHDGDVDAVIACLPGCVTDDRPVAYEPITVGEHLRAKLDGSRGRRLNPAAGREAARLAGA
ncbi:2OG-Fe(II) oxygenase superfamily protein [Actinomadura rubteroloni]|uniref:2OG-Fe(II) oxygenase superfamily protein n=1 Tax=Actinomadura rubteroloni TaxID=1926885 RepID=A0A2P4UM69_9ACTN|nr:2-oxoglutarate and iron-dependent oxygenase domain-containing protein [Actinomadura rubteroloni]POM26150.1 2OG-Fe(II) oxygenase superfamily protein [Actinomadura rubteroloni]